MRTCLPVEIMENPAFLEGIARLAWTIPYVTTPNLWRRLVLQTLQLLPMLFGRSCCWSMLGLEAGSSACIKPCICQVESQQLAKKWSPFRHIDHLSWIDNVLTMYSPLLSNIVNQQLIIDYWPLWTTSISSIAHYSESNKRQSTSINECGPLSHHSSSMNQHYPCLN